MVLAIRFCPGSLPWFCVLPVFCHAFHTLPPLPFVRTARTRFCAHCGSFAAGRLRFWALRLCLPACRFCGSLPPAGSGLVYTTCITHHRTHRLPPTSSRTACRTRTRCAGFTRTAHCTAARAFTFAAPRLRGSLPVASTVLLPLLRILDYYYIPWLRAFGSHMHRLALRLRWFCLPLPAWFTRAHSTCHRAHRFATHFRACCAAGFCAVAFSRLLRGLVLPRFCAALPRFFCCTPRLVCVCVCAAVCVRAVARSCHSRRVRTRLDSVAYAAFAYAPICTRLIPRTWITPARLPVTAHHYRAYTYRCPRTYRYRYTYLRYTACALLPHCHTCVLQVLPFCLAQFTCRTGYTQFYGSTHGLRIRYNAAFGSTRCALLLRCHCFLPGCGFFRFAVTTPARMVRCYRMPCRLPWFAALLRAAAFRFLYLLPAVCGLPRSFAARVCARLRFRVAAHVTPPHCGSPPAALPATAIFAVTPWLRLLTRRAVRCLVRHYYVTGSHRAILPRLLRFGYAHRLPPACRACARLACGCGCRGSRLHCGYCRGYYWVGYCFLPPPWFRYLLLVLPVPRIATTLPTTGPLVTVGFYHTTPPFVTAFLRCSRTCLLPHHWFAVCMVAALTRFATVRAHHATARFARFTAAAPWTGCLHTRGLRRFTYRARAFCWFMPCLFSCRTCLVTRTRVRFYAVYTRTRTAPPLLPATGSHATHLPAFCSLRVRRLRSLRFAVLHLPRSATCAFALVRFLPAVHGFLRFYCGWVHGLRTPAAPPLLLPPHAVYTGSCGLPRLRAAYCCSPLRCGLLRSTCGLRLRLCGSPFTALHHALWILLPTLVYLPRLLRFCLRFPHFYHGYRGSFTTHTALPRGFAVACTVYHRCYLYRSGCTTFYRFVLHLVRFATCLPCGCYRAHAWLRGCTRGAARTPACCTAPRLPRIRLPLRLHTALPPARFCGCHALLHARFCGSVLRAAAYRYRLLLPLVLHAAVPVFLRLRCGYCALRFFGSATC